MAPEGQMRVLDIAAHLFLVTPRLPTKGLECSLVTSVCEHRVPELGTLWDKVEAVLFVSGPSYEKLETGPCLPDKGETEGRVHFLPLPTR